MNWRLTKAEKEKRRYWNCVIAWTKDKFARTMVDLVSFVSILYFFWIGWKRIFSLRFFSAYNTWREKQFCSLLFKLFYFMIGILLLYLHSSSSIIIFIFLLYFYLPIFILYSKNLINFYVASFFYQAF